MSHSCVNDNAQRVSVKIYRSVSNRKNEKKIYNSLNIRDITSICGGSMYGSAQFYLSDSVRGIETIVGFGCVCVWNALGQSWQVS